MRASLRCLPSLVLLALLVAPGAAAAPLPARDLIVVLEPGAAADAVLAVAPAAVPLRSAPAVVVHDAPEDLERALAALPGVLRVVRASPLEFHSLDSLLLTRAAPGPRGLGDLPYTGAGVTVAVVDSGIDATHPDLAGRVKANVRLVDGRFVETPGDLTGHGTHVAAIVAGSGATGDAYRGVAPSASLVGIDITDRFTTASALLAYDWLYVNGERLGIDAVVNAWGRTGRGAFDPDDAVSQAIDRVVDEGAVVLFSTSNHGPGPSSLSFESQHPRVVTVGATDDAGLVMPYSSRGPALGTSAIKPDVVAPGEGIVSARSATSPLDAETDPDPMHRSLSGTSQSVPHVAGVVALMLEARPDLAPLDVQRALHESAIDLGEPGPDAETGFGLVDARDAVRVALGLAPDRQNVLVAGGVDSRAERAQLAPAASAPGGLFPFGAAREAAAPWSLSFPVKPGAERLDFEVSWPASLAPATVTLVEPDGEAAGTWDDARAAGERATVAGAVDSPIGGVWTLRVASLAPVALDVDARVDVTLPPNATRAAALDPRYRLADPEPPGAFESAFDGWRARARLFAQANPAGAAVVAVGAASLVLAGGLGASALVARRSRRLEAAPPEPDSFK